MATVSFTIPDAVMPRVTDAFVAVYGYSSTLPNGDPNPETQVQFARRMVREYVRNVLAAFEAGSAGETASVAADQKARDDIG